MISEKLEALTDEELRRLAARLGLDLPDDLDRIFVLEEILDALEEDARGGTDPRSAPPHAAEIKYTSLSSESIPRIDLGAAILPERYGETMIRAMARDPSWAFAFWDLADTDRHALGEEESLLLRVSEICSSPGAAKREVFEIPVSVDDSQWYINLPRSGSCYRIELCARSGSRVRSLARAAELSVPRQSPDHEGSAIDAASAELLRLSGFGIHEAEPGGDDHPQKLLASDREGE